MNKQEEIQQLGFTAEQAKRIIKVAKNAILSPIIIARQCLADIRNEDLNQD